MDDIQIIFLPSAWIRLEKVVLFSKGYIFIFIVNLSKFQATTKKLLMYKEHALFINHLNIWDDPYRLPNDFLVTICYNSNYFDWQMSIANQINFVMSLIIATLYLMVNTETNRCRWNYRQMRIFTFITQGTGRSAMPQRVCSM